VFSGQPTLGDIFQNGLDQPAHRAMHEASVGNGLRGVRGHVDLSCQVTSSIEDSGAKERRRTKERATRVGRLRAHPVIGRDFAINFRSFALK